MPSKLEQDEISVFFERISTNLDRQRSALNLQMNLLEEKRSALITKAVTKGLNPDVQMKDSGVGWIGKIPSHWELKSLHHVCKQIQIGPFGAQLHASDYVDGGIP